MGEWVERFTGHDVWPQLEALSRAVASLQEQGSSDSIVVEAILRLAALTSRATSVAKSGDPLTAPIQPLANALPHISNTQQEITNFLSNENLSHLRSANAHAESLLQALMPLAVVAPLADPESLQESVVSFRRALGQHLRYSEQEVETLRNASTALNASLEKLKAEVDRQSTRLDTAITGFQEAFTTAQDERRKQFLATEDAATASVKQWREELDAALADHEATFSELLAGLRTGQKEWEEKRAEDGAAVINAAKNSADALVDQMKVRLAEVEKIAGAVSERGMAGGFQKVANAERRQMWVWQGILVISVIAFTVVVAAFLPDGTGAFSWNLFAKRMLLTLGFAGLAGYSAREASRHGEKERLNRRLELEIASLGPFIAVLDQGKQHALREKIAERLFGQQHVVPALEEGGQIAGGLMDLLKMMTNEVVKGRRG